MPKGVMKTKDFILKKMGSLRLQWMGCVVSDLKKNESQELERGD